MALADFRQLTDAKLRDTAGIILPPDRDLLILEAIKTYSGLRPRERVQTLTGDGVAVTFALASDFEERFSVIAQIEYPTGRPEPVYLDAENWTFYRDATTGALKIRLLNLVLSSAVTAFITYTARHAVTEGIGAVDTVPVVDRDPICDLAASLGFEQMAAYYGQELEPSLAADLTRGQDRGHFYLDMASRRRRAWQDAMGLSQGVVAASKNGDLDVELFHPGGPPRFFHGD